MKRYLTIIALSISVLTTWAGVEVVPLPCGEAVMLIATPYTNYQFDSWTDGNTDNPRIVSVEQDSTFGARWKSCPAEMTTLTERIFKGESYWFADKEISKAGTYYDTLSTVAGCDSIIKLKLNVLPLPSYTIRVASSNESWGICLGTGSYKQGSVVTLLAIPAKGYIFYRWYNEATGEIVPNVNPYQYTISGSDTWMGYFRRAPHRLYVENYAEQRSWSSPQENTCVVSISGRNVQIANNTDETCYLYDVAGHLICASKEYDVKTLTQGVYIIILNDESERFVIY